jgi:hypothetical protein
VNFCFLALAVQINFTFERSCANESMYEFRLNVNSCFLALAVQINFTCEYSCANEAIYEFHHITIFNKTNFYSKQCIGSADTLIVAVRKSFFHLVLVFSLFF